MRSKWLFAFATLASLTYWACSGQEEVADTICRSTYDCTFGSLSDSAGASDDLMGCTARLNDAVQNYQTSLTGISRCADCLGRNPNSCSTLAKDRACDQACSEVQLVLNAMTSANDRAGSCNTVATACGYDAKACTRQLALSLIQDPSLQSEPALASCVSCLNLAAAVVVMDAGAAPAEDPTASAGGAPNCVPLKGQLPRLDECAAVVTACAKQCLQQPQLGLALAGAALTVCQRGGERCVHPMHASDADAGVGAAGATGVAGAPGQGDSCSPAVSAVRCYQGLIQATSSAAVVACAACLATNPDCDTVAANCPDCLTLSFE
jgi:hypothetical protein